MSSCRATNAKEAPAKIEQPPPRASVKAPDSVPVSSLPVVEKVRTAFAHFESNELFECLDFESHPDKIPSAEKMAPSVRIDAPCEEKFAGRTVLATCSMRRPDFKATAIFYDFDSVSADDHLMIDCMKDGGEWKSIPRDSFQWHQAGLESAGKNLHKVSQRQRLR